MILEMAKLFQYDANVKNQTTQFTPSNTISNNIEKLSDSPRRSFYYFIIIAKREAEVK
jgi:hypothetical protein